MSIAAAVMIVFRRVSRCRARVNVTAMRSLRRRLVVARLGVVGLRLGMLFVEVLLERDAAERPEIDVERRPFELREAPLHTIEPGLGVPHAARHAAEGGDAVVEIERLPVGLRRSREVVALLRHAAEIAGALPQRVAAILIAAGELRRLALAGGVAQTPRL